MTRISQKIAILALSLGLAACASAPAPKQYQAPIAGELHEILHRRDHTGSRVSARFVDVLSGQEIYAWEPDRPVIPASNMKIVVTATGLDLFGPNHTFKTWLCMDGANLWIIGSGDPAVGDPSIARKYGQKSTAIFDQWVAALRDKGITRIEGDLIYYDAALDDKWTHDSWGRDDLTHWYAAPISGLNFNDNCVDITVFPQPDKTSSGYETLYSVTPALKGITVVNHCVTGEKHAPTIEKKRNEPVYILGGTVTKKESLKSKPVDDPGAFFADALRTHFSDNGFYIKGETRRSDKPLGGSFEPPADKVVAVHETKIMDMLARINKNSQNLLAEGLCKLNGQQYMADRGMRVKGSWTFGQRASEQFLDDYDIDHEGLVMADGSGLSRENRVTTRMISNIFLTMGDHPAGKQYRQSLTISGTDGTIGRRMGDDMAGRVYAKTGYIGGVRSLSGYIHTQDDRWVVFSIIYNDIKGTVKPYEELQDAACRAIFESTIMERVVAKVVKAER